MADFRDVCVWLSVRFHRPSHRGAAWRGNCRGVALRPAAIFRELTLYRRQASVMSSHPRQLALALCHAENFAREDFLSGPSNAVALALIDAWPDWSHRTVMLTGPEGSGKSHLAAIWAHAAGARLVAPRAPGGTRRTPVPPTRGAGGEGPRSRPVRARGLLPL